MKTLITITTLAFVLVFNSCIPKKNTASEYKALAENYRLNEKMKKSAKALERAAQLDPNDVDTYIALAEAIRMGWNYSEKTRPKVNDAYNKALDIEPWSPKVLISRAKFHEMMAENKLAEQDLDTVLRKELANTAAYLLKADLHFFGRDTSGFSVLRTAYNHVPQEERGSIMNAKAFKELRLSLYERSIKSYKQEQALTNKKYKSTNCTLAWAFAQIGNRDSACYYYGQCEEKIFRTLIDYDELEKLCGKK